MFFSEHVYYIRSLYRARIFILIKTYFHKKALALQAFTYHANEAYIIKYIKDLLACHKIKLKWLVP